MFTFCRKLKFQSKHFLAYIFSFWRYAYEKFYQNRDCNFACVVSTVGRGRHILSMCHMDLQKNGTALRSESRVPHEKLRTHSFKQLEKNMNQMNQVVIAGNIVRVPEMKTTANGKSLVTFTIASNRYIKKGGDDFVQEVCYFDCEAWGRTAEIIIDKASKGIGCQIVGRLKQDRWKGSDGKTHSKIAIVVEHIDFRAKSEKEDDENGADEAEHEQTEKSTPSFDRATIFQNREEEPFPKASGFDIF